MAKVEKEHDVEAAITAVAVTLAMPRDRADDDSFAQAKARKRVRQRLDRAGRLARLLCRPA